MVVMVPFGDTMRMRLLVRSAIYRFPAASTATPCGLWSIALVAGPPSPEKPASVKLVAGHRGDNAVGRQFADLVVAGVRKVEVAGGVHRESPGVVDQRVGARPPSPLEPTGAPTLALTTVDIKPVAASTLRMRLLPVSEM